MSGLQHCHGSALYTDETEKRVTNHPGDPCPPLHVTQHHFKSLDVILNVFRRFGKDVMPYILLLPRKQCSCRCLLLG